MRKTLSALLLIAVLSCSSLAGEIPIGSNPAPLPPPPCDTCSTTTTTGEIPIGSIIIQAIIDVILP